MTIGAAIIGCGLIGRKRAAAMAVAGMELRAVHDVDRQRAESLAGEFGAEVADSAAKAFSTAGVEVAIVATLHADLTPLAEEALNGGLHVLVEKPGGVDASALRRLDDAAARQSRVVRVGFNHRFHPALRRARELATEGLGDLLYVRGRYGHGGRVGYEQEWRADRSRSGGGELLDQGIHLIDLTRFLVGDVSLLFADLTTRFWKMDVEDNAFLCLRPAAGGTAWLHASWTEWKNLFSLEVAYTTAKLEVTGLGGSYGVERLTRHAMRPQLGPPDTTTWEFPRPDTSWEDELVDFVGAIGGARGLGATAGDAAAALDIVGAAYQR